MALRFERERLSQITTHTGTTSLVLIVEFPFIQRGGNQHPLALLRVLVGEHFVQMFQALTEEVLYRRERGHDRGTPETVTD